MTVLPDSDSISIHAPHAGSDSGTLSRPCLASYFNPRSPCGERLPIDLYSACATIFQSTLPMRGATDFSDALDDFWTFQSTLPMRGATLWAKFEPRNDQISIHAPHAGSDLGSLYDAVQQRVFQSTLPMRGATRCGSRCVRARGFQSTLPMRGATMPSWRCATPTA